MLSFDPYLKDNCLQQHWALHQLRMSVAMPGRGWAAKLIPGANLDFRSFAIFFVPPADSTAVQPLLPFGCSVPVSPRQTCALQSQAESPGEGPWSPLLLGQACHSLTWSLATHLNSLGLSFPN